MRNALSGYVCESHPHIVQAARDPEPINKLAEMGDIKQSTLDNIMQGRTQNPGTRTIHKVALAFSMTPAEFRILRS